MVITWGLFPSTISLVLRQNFKMFSHIPTASRMRCFNKKKYHMGWNFISLKTPISV